MTKIINENISVRICYNENCIGGLHVLFIIFVAISIIGYLLIKLKDRSIFGGLLFSGGLIFSFFTILFLGLSILEQRNPHGAIFALIVFYGILPLIFLAGCIYLVFNSNIMRTKEGKSMTAKLCQR